MLIILIRRGLHFFFKRGKCNTYKQGQAEQPIRDLQRLPLTKIKLADG